MMDITKFLQESAKFMAADRPDIWNLESAFESISHMFSHVAGQDETCSIGTGGFTLTKFVSEEDGIIEYCLDRKIVEFAIYEDEDETLLTNWIENSALSNIGLDIQDPDFDSDDEL